MKITSLKNLHFQRNGVAGEPFYSCVVKTSDEKGKEFLVSFCADPDTDRKVITSSCRAVCLGELETSWRGDCFAYALQDHFDKIGSDIYDLTKKEIYSV